MNNPFGERDCVNYGGNIMLFLSVLDIADIEWLATVSITFLLLMIFSNLMFLSSSKRLLLACVAFEYFLLEVESILEHNVLSNVLTFPLANEVILLHLSKKSGQSLQLSLQSLRCVDWCCMSS